MGKKYTKSQVDSLNRDSEFQTIVGSDEELKRLFEAPKRTRDDRITELALALGGTAEIGDGSIPAPTAGILMMLGVIESPLLAPDGFARLIDVDIALWVFSNGRTALDGAGGMSDIETLADGACSAAGIDPVEAWTLMRSMVIESFAGLERIPESGAPGGNRCRFDLGWFASVTSRVAESANVTAEYAGWEMPLALATHYIVAHYHKNGGKTYEPNASAKVLERLNELMDKRITEKKYK